MKQRQVWVLSGLIPVITILVIIITHLRYNPIIIKPIGYKWNTNSYDDSFHDTLNTGKFTKIDSLQIDSNSVYFSATLGDGAKFAFAGITFRPDSFEIDINKYDIFEIQILPGCSDFNFTATLRIPGFSDSLSANDTHKYHQKEFSIADNINKVFIDFDELPTPVWWYSMNNVKREELLETDKSHFSSFSFSNHPSQKRSETFIINVGIIRVLRDWKRGIMPFLYSCIFSLILIIIYSLLHKNEKYLAINPVDIINNSENDKVLKFIGENYKQRGLSIELVAQECFQSSYQVRKALSEKYGCNFNEYVRKVRIEEGARLLKESKMDIKQIAYEVGFSHSTSFNRAFKLEKNISPSQYRLQYNK